MVKILIVEDEKRIIDSLLDAFKLEGYFAKGSNTIKEAQMNLYNEPFDIILLDLWLPDGDGMKLIEELNKNEIRPDIIVMTGHGTIEKAVNAIKLGAFDFIEKPLNLNRVLVSIKNCIKLRKTTCENIEIKNRGDETGEIIGESRAIKDVLQIIDKVAKTDGRVLITGENGTGKELVARLIHRRSLKKDQPFIKVNCAAIPKELIESELFGYEKGAFTGAVGLKYGKFELAHKGTIFLDEIGDMDLSLQAKILRVLQDGEFERVGSNKTIKVDVRVISATNKDIKKEVDEKRFREDLYYRLNVIPIYVPPLRERREDIILLVNYFLNKFCIKNNKKLKTIETEACKFLMALEWKGNVRELQNIIERIVILSSDEIIRKKDVENIIGHKEINIQEYHGEQLRALVAEFEKMVILKALQYSDGSIQKTAEHLGLERTGLYKKMERLGIKKWSER
ncbi:MAG: sigma-54 dependent transcriptional regulator [Candidatus Hydrogenedentota bacterium]